MPYVLPVFLPCCEFGLATLLFQFYCTSFERLWILCRCPAGVGKWAAHYIQPAVPLTRPEETSFHSPYLGTEYLFLSRHGGSGFIPLRLVIKLIRLVKVTSSSIYHLCLVDHLITILATILLPFRERVHLLREI
jgi:hypothetical protein